jgi:hypothetical protein
MFTPTRLALQEILKEILFLGGEVFLMLLLLLLRWDLSTLPRLADCRDTPTAAT